MERGKHGVKIPCNHRLEWADLSTRNYYTHMGTGHGMPYECQACREESGGIYFCRTCTFGAHVECIDFPEVINYPFHSRHPLRIVWTKTIDYTDGKCHFCREKLGLVMYHCSICNFSVDLECWSNPPPLTIHQPKSHDHAFTLMPIKAPFTCNACAMAGERNPYLCLECGYMLHKDCINLPRVINVNRHDHRVSRTYHLGQGDWECGVCRKTMDWTFGAFSCNRCLNYAVHSKCAIRSDVWDRKELEDEPEEEEEEDPYEVINEKEIIHFSHEHNLRLVDDNVHVDYQKLQCNACILPINSDPFFKCVKCEFILHKVCASLPRRKRNILYNQKLTLKVDNEVGKHFKCSSCLKVFDGFRYYYQYYFYYAGMSLNQEFVLDMRCGTISEPFHHELHPHPLYRTSAEQDKTCGACGENSKFFLSCIVCEFTLGMECATLPRKVKHRCDDHVLSLHHGAGNSNGQLWCDICEGRTDPSFWFYGCDDCGTTLHIKCVLGDMYYLKPGNTYWKGELVPNDGMTRPFCIACGNRCIFPFFLKGIATSDSTVIYACSTKCAYGTESDHGPWRKWYYSIKEVESASYGSASNGSTISDESSTIPDSSSTQSEHDDDENSET